MLLNLIVNAQHALHQVPPPRVIEVGTTSYQGATGPMLRLWVTDNGPGITPAVAAYIFEPFFSTRPVGQGTGLGLSISQSIVQAHGGQLGFSNAPGSGARFTVELPIATAPAAPRPVQPPASERPAARPVGRTILLVEDDPTVVGIMCAPSPPIIRWSSPPRAARPCA